MMALNLKLVKYCWNTGIFSGLLNASLSIYLYLPKLVSALASIHVSVFTQDIWTCEPLLYYLQVKPEQNAPSVVILPDLGLDWCKEISIYIYIV